MASTTIRRPFGRRAVLAAGALSLVLVACGSSSKAATTTTTGAATTTSAPGGSSTTTAAPGAKLANFTPVAGAKAVDCKPKSGPVKAAWVYVGPINDGGWTQAHDDGRKAVVAALGNKVVTTYKENVPEGPQVSQVLEDLIKDGNNIIFGTSFGFQDQFIETAAKHPNVCFEFFTGYKNAANVSQAYGAGEDTDYLAGYAAGAASKSGKVGFVAPFPIPEVIREINSYALGVKAAHPGGTVRVVFTNTWFDPTKERSAADALIAAGVDALGSGQDSPASGEAAKAKGLPWSGYDADQSKNFPEIWLTATNYHWGPYETSRIQSVIDGTWMPGNYYGGISDGFVTLAPFGKLVSSDTQGKIADKIKGFKDGSFSQFTGPITDQGGKVQIESGKKITFDQLMSMNYLVDNVVGDLPKS